MIVSNCYVKLSLSLSDVFLKQSKNVYLKMSFLFLVLTQLVKIVHCVSFGQDSYS